MNDLLKSVLLCATLAVTSVGVTRAHAAWLYWSKVPTRAASETQCYDRAAALAERYLTGIRRTPVEIAGNFREPRSGHVSYVAITCIARGRDPPMAVVMATGDNGELVRQARDAFSVQLEFSSP